jgi:predicted DNA-binding transcriptional regulator YafY
MVVEPSVDSGVERILGLLWLFRKPNVVRAADEIEEAGYPDLAGEDSVGRRNFFNDRERLRDLGLELVDEGPGRYRMSGETEVDIKFTAEEREALAAAELAVGDPIDPGSEPRPQGVPVLLAAALSGHVVRFNYSGRQREVVPARLSLSSTGRWYVHGVSGDGATKTYRIDRIEGDVEVDRTQAKIVDSSDVAHPVLWNRDQAITATVRFAHEPSAEWVHLLGGGQAPNNPANEAWTFTTTNHRSFIRRLLAIGPSAQLLEPVGLLDQLRHELDGHRTV